MPVGGGAFAHPGVPHVCGCRGIAIAEQEAWDGTGWLPLRVNVCVCGDVQVRVLSKVSDVSRSSVRGQAGSAERAQMHRLVARWVTSVGNTP